MDHTKIKRGRLGTGYVLKAAAVLAFSVMDGCGGSGGSSPAAAVANAAPTQMTGTVAVGSPVSGANVTVLDVNGATASATTNASGTYTVSLAGLTAPFVIVATDPSGVNPDLVSVVPTVPTGSSAPVVANVTTLTSAVAALLTTSGNPLDVASSGNLASVVTPSTVNAAVTTLNTALAPILTANGLSATSFDPIGGAFSANQTGADAVIDTVSLVQAPGSNGGTELVSNDPNTTTGITLNNSTPVTATLPAPTVAANYLAPLMTELGQCLGGNTASCSQAIDAHYVDNGYTSFTAAHPAFAASGVTLGLAQTLKFFTNNGTPEALVRLRYTTSSGAEGSAVTVVKKVSASVWDIVGNQQPFDVTITSFVARRTFVDTTNKPYSRYESGIGISIPAGASGTPNPTNLASVEVTGPGINGVSNGTTFLVPRSGSGNGTLALTGNLLTQVPSTPVTSNTNTNLYRWSWHALPGATGTYVPNTNDLGFSTQTPIDVSNVPYFASYTVAFFDSTGTQIGSTFTVVNPTPPVGWNAGTATQWQTLSPSSISAFLNPAGSLAGAQSAVNLSWSNLIGGYNIAPVASKSQIQAVPATGAEVDGWWDGPATYEPNGQYSATVKAGVDQYGVQQCSTPCPFPALVAGGVRIAELNWTVAQTAYYNIWRYAVPAQPS
jgi:hypothetical protein